MSASHARDREGGTAGKVTRADIEAKFRELQGGVEDVAEQAKGYAAYVGAGIAVVVVVLIFLLGRRSGKRRSTVVEIRRV
ncbi:MAG: hypothetical protein ACKVWR_12170 [Acidimicrobiales bacterium]